MQLDAQPLGQRSSPCRPGGAREGSAGEGEANKPEPPTHGHGPRAQPTLARLLSPAHEALHQALLTREILGGDETRWPLLGSKSQTRWHAWALCAPDAVVYRIQEGRDTEAARHMLQEFGGILMVDGPSTYESAAAGSGGKLTQVNCWMHARRKYVECVEAFPQAEPALEMIAGLYAVECEYKEGPESLERLLELRQQKSRPII